MDVRPCPTCGGNKVVAARDADGLHYAPCPDCKDGTVPVRDTKVDTVKSDA